MNAIPLESVEVNEVTPIEDYWSEPEETIEVSFHEPDIIIAQNEAYEAEKEIDVILERPEEPQNESKEDQPLVLVKPPTLPCLPVKFTKGVVIKERSQIFYMADTFVSDDDDAIDSYVLEVPNELLHLKEGMYDELPKAIDASFVFDILILVLNLEDKVWDKFGGVSESIPLKRCRMKRVDTSEELADNSIEVLFRFTQHLFRGVSSIRPTLGARRNFEMPGLKKPRAQVPPSETIVSPSLKNLLCVIVSVAKHN
ncbi:hypothetical protein Sjap_025402 [Stephania japonica]|uniref:Uncharacterized protein n=1 Tax=Stephania japonica TaxID=461633 RepID=A0AAP0HHX1_9MAGN